MCLDDDQIVALLEGTVSAADRGALEAHLDECPACRRLVGSAFAVPPVEIGPDAETVSARETKKSNVAEVRAASPVLRGTSVSRYLILDVVGAGGMGIVYAAYDPELDRKVAVKVLRTGGAERGASLRGRVLREAQAMARLTHPNVVSVYDVGVANEQVFLVMEFIRGTTLRRWLAQGERPYRAVLDVFRLAGLGLAAAHAAGLVHCDFKPDNVLVDPAGRVLVTDFGLARAAAPGAPPDAEALDAPIPDPLAPTPSVAIGGTPAYMAPEQIYGGAADPRSDVFSFSVALFEALYGQRPFSGDSLEGLHRSIAGGCAPPPAGTLVPAWVHRALVRGLALHADERHPSLEALLATLGDDPAVRRRARWRNAGLGVAASALVAVAAAGWAKTTTFRDPCEHPERQLAGAWDEDIRGRVRAALLGTRRSYAESTVVRVEAALDRYGADWAQMQGEVCVAGRRPAPSRELLGLRAACLDRRRGQLQALTTVLADKPDTEILDRAVQVASDLYPIAYCADTGALTARIPPAEDPALRARIAKLEPQVDRLDALLKAGKFSEGLLLGKPLLVEVATIPYAPLRGQLEFVMGQLTAESGDAEAGKALLLRAAISASAGKDDVTAALAWTYLLPVVADNQGRFEEASVIRALGETAQVRAPDDRTQSHWLNAQGVALSRMGKYPEAMAVLERALALLETKSRPAEHEIAAALSNMAGVAQGMDDLQGARSYAERAIALLEKSLGPDHPDVATALNNLGNIVHAMGDDALAAATQERSLAINEKSRGPDSPAVAMSLNNLGNALFGAGDYPGAKARQERALAIFEKTVGPEHLYVTYTRAGLGRTEMRLGQLVTAQVLIERSLGAREKLMGSSNTEVAEPLLYLGELHLARGEAELAAPLLERALALENAEFRSEVQLTLAEALWRLGKARPRARDLAGMARAHYDALHHRSGLLRASRWLADHPGAS